MSKFYQALEQAKRDRALTPHGSPGRYVAQPEPHAGPPASPSLPAPPAVAPPASAPPEGVDEHLVSLLTPAAFEAEQYRALRHVVEQMHRAGDLRVVAVSSPAVGDGKTLTAINLAGALGQAPDMRVLLIDADLRRPAVARLLGRSTDGAPGLVDAILDPSMPLDTITQPCPPFNIDIVEGGSFQTTPYEVLRHPRLGELLDEARRRYDFVILDTPPLAPVQDCRLLARWVDGFLLVVAAHRTPRRPLEECLTALEPGKLIGLVFNQDDSRQSSAYSGYYGHPVDHPDNGNGGPRTAWKRVAAGLGRSLRRRGRAPEASVPGGTP